MSTVAGRNGTGASGGGGTAPAGGRRDAEVGGNGNGGGASVGDAEGGHAPSGDSGGGDNGAGGGAEGGGSGDSAGAGGCDGAEDCGTGDPCTVVDCVARRCQSEPRCPADGACSATCTVMSSGVALCGTVAPDADGDQHGVAACWRGDDCDDTNSAVHPGAEESCNGVDENCDGKSDVGEFGLSGTNRLFRALGDDTSLEEIAAVWSPRARSLAVVWEDQGVSGTEPSRCRLNFLGLDGEPRFSPDLVVSDTPEGATAPSVAATQDYIGVAWIDLRPDAPGVYFRRYEAASGAGDEPTLMSTPETNPLRTGQTARHRPQVVALPDDKWMVFWIAEVRQDSEQVYFATRERSGPATGPGLAGEPGGTREHLRVAAVGSAVAAVWATRPTPDYSIVEWELIRGVGPIVGSQGRLSPQSSGVLASATNPVVSGFAGGFDIAYRWRDTRGGTPVESLWVTRRGLDGAAACSFPTDGEFYPTGIAHVPTGFAIAGYRGLPGGTRDVLIAGYDQACGVIAEPTVVGQEDKEAYLAGPVVEPFSTTGSSGLGLVWGRASFGVGASISSRFMGFNLCD